MTIKNYIYAIESPVDIALGEGVVYTYDFANVGTPASINSEAVYDEDGADQSSTMLSGVSSIQGDVVTAKKFTPTVKGNYRYRVSVNISGSVVYGLCDFYCFDPSKKV